MNPRAVIIDDEASVCWTLQQALQRDGYRADIAGTAEAGLHSIRSRSTDIVFLDIRMPGMDGLQALDLIHRDQPELPVVIMTAHGDLQTAVHAMRRGAYEYLTKPFDLDHALRVARQARQRTDVAHVVASEVTEPELIGASSAMQAVYRQIALVSAHNACVLVTGESGTGKELVAQALHRHSDRCNGPFIPIHAAALNPGLIESELFGHMRGSFTGARESRTGLLALSHSGTVFLDEIAEIPLGIQVKLLRALELGEVLPVGGSEPRRFDFRIIAATNRDLNQLVDEGRFRQDLFYRLNVYHIHMPPLRDRPEDIPALTAYFLSRFESRPRSISSDALAHLARQYWPGNVREFRNAIERAAILARGSVILPEHFQEYSMASAGQNDLQLCLQRWLHEQFRDGDPTCLIDRLQQSVEPYIFRELLRRAQGNRSQTAEWLGLDRATVRKKLQQYDVESDGL